MFTNVTQTLLPLGLFGQSMIGRKVTAKNIEDSDYFAFAKGQLQSSRKTSPLTLKVYFRHVVGRKNNPADRVEFQNKDGNVMSVKKISPGDVSTEFKLQLNKLPVGDAALVAHNESKKLAKLPMEVTKL